MSSLADPIHKNGGGLPDLPCDDSYMADFEGFLPGISRFWKRVCNWYVVQECSRAIRAYFQKLPYKITEIAKLHLGCSQGMYSYSGGCGVIRCTANLTSGFSVTR